MIFGFFCEADGHGNQELQDHRFRQERANQLFMLGESSSAGA
jgi:hypothetical protein